ncbi:hypothetical protein ACP70R_019800 [Stipagrostis hirtigluma subsp. patula]
MSEPTAPHPRSPAAAELPPDDVLRDVFLRLPPEPGHLLAASLVCRHWRLLVRDPAFLRRFRAFHRTPPVLGFFENTWSLRRLPSGPSATDHRRSTRFVPTAVPVARLARPEPEPTGWVLDCRHGRVLLFSQAEQALRVWDPMVGDTHHVACPPASQGWDVDFAAALVCAAGHDDHTDCRSSTFQIVFLDASWGDGFLVSVCIYSSEAGAWGDWVEITSLSPVGLEAATLVGDSLYWQTNFTEEGCYHILELELPTQRLDFIELPEGVKETYLSDIRIMPAEDGGIGFAGVNESKIHFWSRTTDHHGVSGWVLTRIIDMDKFTLSGLPTGDILLWSSVVGFAEDSDELFLQSESGIFMINIRSMQLSKVAEASGADIYPYTSFYTRGRDIPGIDDRDE